MPVDPAVLNAALANARRALLDARGPHGHWEGELSSSALSTATAVFALSQVLESQTGDKVDPAFAATAGRLIRQGLGWLALNQNADGGWGDTTASHSNISTTCLCWSAFVADENWAAGAYDATLRAAEGWLIKHVGTLDPKAIAVKVTERYGEDHTFSVPILTMMALAGRLGQGPWAWDLVPPLPFEFAAFPQRMFKWLKLPVVSYALPALIAIGQVRHARRPSAHAPIRVARAIANGPTLKLLGKVQPTSGGFLEATPLTSFVTMSLAAAGAGDHAVVKRGVKFLIDSVRDDGSWPIDTNLATWVTTLAVNALAAGPDFAAVLPEADRKPVRDWLLGQQYRTEHPYTLADPGGWAWTDLTGGVPDADDTPGAMLAVRHLAGGGDARSADAAAMAARWLAGLQNADGGIPTFCRGWTKQPFDRSSADLSAHTLRAWAAWDGALPPKVAKQVAVAGPAAAAYLAKVQRRDGAWEPLWFGNQHVPDDANPLYGTTRVLRAWRSLPEQSVRRGVAWLLGVQRDDGGWGGDAGAPASIEETALAVEALAEMAAGGGPGAGDDVRAAVDRGVAWVIERTNNGTEFPPTPIGFYFAKLWYWEKLYPLVWTVSALGYAASAMGSPK
ncbi:MAG TPA: prenyltransferase/squalene oxidase repeat-containing protein, partial [Humisphaera sp.]